MGLDIAFNREKAIAAGLQLQNIRNGTDDDIRRAMDHVPGDTEYIEYLNRVDEYVVVPGTHLNVHNGGTPETIVIRANKWGSVYYPMTAWLRHHNIQWSEG